MSRIISPLPVARPENVASQPSRRLFLRRSAGITLAAGGAALLAKPSRALANHQTRESFQSIRRHENNHVEFLVGALGNNARPKPTFQNLDTTNELDFFFLSQTFENLGVKAYLGATPFIKSSAFLGAAAQIALVEASHAGYLNVLVGDPITNDSMTTDKDDEFGPSFYYPATAADVAAMASGFIASLNGGPAVTYAQTESDANDIAILNFALALEYLEAEFYNINVPDFD